MSAPYQYIVVKDMNQRGPIAAQVAHAASESTYRLQFDFLMKEVNVVVLVAKDSAALEELNDALNAAPGGGIAHVIIREPDAPFNGCATAVGIAPTRDRDRIRPFVEAFKVLR